jgi:hypothetical protein
MKRHLIGLLFVGAFCAGGEQPSAPACRVMLSNGDRLSGQIRGGSEKTLELTVEGLVDPVVVPFEALARMVFSNPPPASAPPHRVWLADGSRLSGTLASLDEQSLGLDLPGGSKVSVARTSVSAIVLDPETSSVEPVAAGEPEKLYATGGDRLSGKVLKITGGKIQFNAIFGKVQMPIETISGISFPQPAAPEKPQAEMLCRASLINGDQVTGQLAKVTDKGISISSAAAGTIQLEAASLRVLKFARAMQERTAVCLASPGKVVVFTTDGKTDWEVTGLQTPRRVQVLEDGNLLITDDAARRVFEIAPDKRVVWEKAGLQSPVDAQRLPNGNTLIAEQNTQRVVEYDPAGAAVWTQENVPNPMSVQKLTNGNILICESYRNRVCEYTTTGATVWIYESQSNPTSARRLPNGNTLVCEPGQSRIVEVDKAGSVVWRRENVSSPTDAQRLDDGNTLICESGNNRVIEVEPNGKTVWEQKNLHRPMAAARL